MSTSRRGERGTSLVIALVVMLVMGVITAALAGYAVTTSRSSVSYAEIRNERYAGDGAVKAAVKWASSNYRVARDPSINASDPACRYAYNDAKVGNVTVSCAAESGGGSGTPVNVGLESPEALILLGDRRGEPGPYNDLPCSGWWDSFTNFFKLDYDSSENVGRNQTAEYSGLFKVRTGLGTASATCTNPRTRDQSAFTLEGNLATAGELKIDNGSLALVNGKAQLRKGTCPSGVPAATCQLGNAITNRSGYEAPQVYLNGTRPDTDPARTNPNSPKSSAVGTTPSNTAASNDIAAPWAPVGFDPATGSPLPLGYPPTTAMPSAMPQRTTAYLYDSATNALTPTSSCAGTSATVVFLPGWYRDAEVLNRYTTSESCADTTMWFAPDPGPDGKLLTKDDRTGAFYLDFRSGSGRTCNGMAAVRGRWCVGGDASHSPRIVVGTPKDWTPQGVYNPASSGATTTVSITSAGTVDQDLSRSWFNNAGTTAATIDGTFARYQADVCVFGACFSSDRAIRLRNLAPKVTAPPVDGKLFLTVKYGVENPTRVNAAQAVIEAVSPESGRKSCGTYTLLSGTAADSGTNSASPTLHEYRFTDAQATALATACGSTDLVNGLEVKVQVTGNAFNQPRSNWYLDGIKLDYKAVPGASFPAPTGTGSMPAGAKIDCDQAKAGGQLIFGGDSHLYVADGSVEVCAGPYPTDPDNHQAIGVWAAPAVAEVKPTGSVTQGGDTGSLSNTSKLVEIDKDPMFINIPGCAAFCGGDRDAWAQMGMNGYTPPTGYKIDKITARVGYHPRNSNCTGLFGCPGAAPRLETPSCLDDFPKMSSGSPRLQVTNYGSATLYDASSGRNCVGVASGGTSLPSHNIKWHARVDCVAGICGGPYSDEFDGIAYQVTLVPTGASDVKLLPQSGCTVAHPNYNGGTGAPDCAVVRADTSSFADNWNPIWTTPEGQWVGRATVNGTIYAPSSAYEVDDTDAAYPLATRGAVLRHLRVSGFHNRPGYSGTAIGGELDRTPAPREATFTACVQSVARQTAAALCDKAQGDRIITRARVRFEIDTSVSNQAQRAVVPKFEWWSNVRT